MKIIALTFYLLTVCLAVQAQQIESYTFESLNQKIQEESREQVVLVNFWATWCKPCIQELPYFESLNHDKRETKLKVLLVSLDMEKERAENYAQKKQLESEVLYLDEVDFNRWIDQISPDWSGAIPATLMIAPGGREAFYEGSFSKEELYNTVNLFINNSN